MTEPTDAQITRWERTVGNPAFWAWLATHAETEAMDVPRGHPWQSWLLRVHAVADSLPAAVAAIEHPGLTMTRAPRTAPYQGNEPCTGHNPELWFPIRYTHGDAHGRKPASADVEGCSVCDPIRICRNECPIVRECLEWRLRTEDQARTNRHGIWGGTTPSHRDAIHRRRNAVAS